MTIYFSYPVNLIAQQEGGYLVKFHDIPEAISQGENVADALQEAADCLEEAIANRIALKLNLPIPSRPKKGQHLVALHALMAAKAALYLTIRHSKLNNVALAKKLECDEKEIRRLLNPYYQSKLPRIEQVLNRLGQRLDIGVAHL